MGDYAVMDGTRHAEFVIDTIADYESLPTHNAPGSTCLVIDTGDVLILTNDHEWVILGYDA